LAFFLPSEFLPARYWCKHLNPKELYKFGKFSLDVSERLLKTNTGKRVPISDKAFDTLCVLVQNSGKLVTKDRLMEAVWRDSFVEENNIDKCIHVIRRALGEMPGDQKFVETVRRHGYRFVATVVPLRTSRSRPQDLHSEWNAKNGNARITFTGNVEEKLSPRVSASFAIRSNGNWFWKIRRGNKGALLSLAFISLVGVASLCSYFFYTTYPPKENLTKIAVLPMQPIDSATRSEIYELGIADSLINKLNSLNGILARPLNSVRKYSDLGQDALAAGKEQKVDFVVAATYLLSESKIRVTWRLINVANERVEDVLATESGLADVFGKQDALVAEFSNRLASQFDKTFSMNVAKRGTNNEEAYRLYLEGMYLYDRRTPADALRAVEKLNRAIELDPNYALAWAGKAHVHRSLGNFGGSISPHEEYNRSMSALRRSLALDADLSDAHSALCENKFFYEYDYAGAEIECRRAIELDPRSHLAHEIYSRCLWTLGRFDQAISEAKLAIDLRPTMLFTLRNYAITLFYARRFDDALHEFERVSEMDPSFVANYAWFIPAMLVRGDDQAAFAWFIKWQEQMKVDAVGLEDYKNAFRNSGWKGVGEERLKRFEEHKIRSYFLEACLTAHTGNKDKAIEYLEKSYERREWGIPFLQIDPSLDTVRDDPRFIALVKRVKVKPTG
jgi:DNA-binding winged helix-turn-helix (wHTH) protein/tetratricopeptide (TPR) repeat protein